MRPDSLVSCMPKQSKVVDHDTILLSLDGERSYLSGALLLATLACPEPDKRSLRDNLVESIYCHLVLRQCEEDPNWGMQEQAVVPLFLLRAKADAKMDGRALHRRIRDRTDAARVALPFLMHAETGRHGLPKGVRLTIAAVAEATAGQNKNIKLENFFGRIWSPARSVLHLAAALERLNVEFARNEKAFDLLECLRDREFVATWAALAQVTEKLLEKSKLKIDPRTLIKFRFAKPSRQTRKPPAYATTIPRAPRRSPRKSTVKKKP